MSGNTRHFYPETRNSGHNQVQLIPSVLLQVSITFAISLRHHSQSFLRYFITKHQVRMTHRSPSSVADAFIDGVSIDRSDGNTCILSLTETLLREWKGKIGQDDPAVVFNWSPMLHDAVAAINNTQPALPPWCPAGITYPLSVDSVKSMILQKCQGGNTAGGIVSMFVIAPNNFVECIDIVATLSYIQTEPFLLQLSFACQSCIASVFTFHDAKRHITATPLNLPRPDNLAAADIQPFV